MKTNLLVLVALLAIVACNPFPVHQYEGANYRFAVSADSLKRAMVARLPVVMPSEDDPTTGDLVGVQLNDSLQAMVSLQPDSLPNGAGTTLRLQLVRWQGDYRITKPEAQRLFERTAIEPLQAAGLGQP